MAERAELYANTYDDPNYLGELFLIGANQTPFLNMIGGLGGGRTKVTRSFSFPISQPWSLAGASQPAITEGESVTGQNATTTTRAQETNTVQIFQKTVEVSYAKQSEIGAIEGIASVATTAGQPVTDELAFQKMAQLKQVAVDANFSFLNGAYQAKGDVDVAAKTRGIITACVGNNEVKASATDLSKALIQGLLRAMAAAGAVFENPVLLCNALNKQRISDIYGYAPESRNVGGLNIEQIYTDFTKLGVVYDPSVPADTVLIADMAYVFPVVCPVQGKTVFYEDKAAAGASKKGQIYGQLGIDYGPKEYHGIITGLTTS